jgi:hypothetical protein
MLLKIHHINKLLVVTVKWNYLLMQENINIIAGNESNSSVIFHIIMKSKSKAIPVMAH